MKCSECKNDFPPEILSPMFTGKGYSNNICGICALKIKNRIHGTAFKSFHGGIAEEFRLATIDHLWKKKGD